MRSPTPPHSLLCVSDGVLSASSGRKYPKNAVKTHGFEILCAAEVPSVWKVFCHANGVRKVIALLSYRLSVYSRWPLTRTRAGLARQGRLLRQAGGAMWASRPTHNSKAGAHTGCGNPSPPAFAQRYYGFPRRFAPRNDRRGFRQAQQNRRFWQKRRFCPFRGRGRMYGKEKYERLLIAGSQGHDAYDRQHTGQSGQNNIQEHTSDLLFSIFIRKLTG